MSQPAQDADQGPLHAPHRLKYARIERERRYLLACPPPPASVVATREITDRYLAGTRLRLRREAWPDGVDVYKLTQKVPARSPGPVQGLTTNLFLSVAEYDLLAALPGEVLHKVRHSVTGQADAPLGVDVFSGPLQGLVLAEAEFAGDEEMYAFTAPRAAVAEVTADARFTGGRLVRTDREQLRIWLGEFTITLD